MVFQNVGLSRIIENNNHLKFEIDVQRSQCMYKGSWYNATICTKFNCQSFKDCFKTEFKYRYELMCSGNSYDKEHVPMPVDASSGGGRPITSTSYKEALFSLGQKINFIYN